jgi:hypothetical protein
VRTDTLPSGQRVRSQLRREALSADRPAHLGPCGQSRVAGVVSGFCVEKREAAAVLVHGGSSDAGITGPALANMDVL